jgi:hypothetical protein
MDLTPPKPAGSDEKRRVREEQLGASLFTTGLLLAVVLPTILTLSTVREEEVRSAVLKFEALENPTPYGYTVSLLIYLVPVTALIVWFYRSHPPGSFRRRALRQTLLMLVPIGFALDFFLGNTFFLFPNRGAVLGIYVPGFSFSTGGWEWDLPIEEFIFYASGFFAMLLLYIWCNQVWVPAYGVSDHADPAQHPPYIVRIHWRSIYWGVALLAVALFYKKVLAPPDQRDGFPLYMTFLLLAAVVPGMLLHRCAAPFVNWRAFSVTLMWVLLTSLLWEATLASPFGWWRYHDRGMMGLRVKAWADLPVEAVVLWLGVAYTTISVFETVKVFIHMEQPTSVALFGRRKSKPRPITAA